MLPAKHEWPLAVVVGLELNGLGLSRALSARGIRTCAVGTARARGFSHSRSVDRFVPLADWSEDVLIEALIALGRTLERPAVLLQTKDEGVVWTARHRAALEPWYRIPLPDPAVVNLLINKGEFYPLAEREGWPLPGSWSAQSEAELRALMPELPFPCILKPQVKNSLFRRQAIPKAFKPTTREELLAAYRLVAPFEPEVVISEWIEGRDDQLVSCRGYWDANARPVIRFVARKLLQWPVELGNMAVVEAAPEEWWPEPRRIAQQVFDKTGMFGIGAVEFKRRPDGRLVILEPCVGRTVYSHELAPLNGFDIPWACYCDMAFGVQDPEPAYPTQPVKLFDGWRARASAKVYLDRGLLSAAEIRAIEGGPQSQMLFRRNDPVPWISETVHQGSRTAYGSLKRLLRRARRQPTVAGPPG